MSASIFTQPTSTAASATRAIPPYAGPLHAPGGETRAIKVGPFVPAEQRQPVAWDNRSEPVAMAAPAATVVEMVVPASIPPYRPLRPTPIISPAVRTPLYIPSVPTPSSDLALEEGMIDPQLVPTEEFATPDVAAELPLATSALSADSVVDDPAAIDSAALPWIDAFLASTPALPMHAVAVEDEALSALVDSQDAGDEWPLEEAATEFRALRTAMNEQTDDDPNRALERGAIEASTPAPLPEWGEDDLMDIMPIRHSGKTPLSNTAVPADGELWAERARKAHEEAQVSQAMASAHSDPQAADESVRASHLAPESTAEEAAHALELLARRVRAGELTLPSYDPRMGEPAALVAALAALLGVKLR